MLVDFNVNEDYKDDQITFINNSEYEAIIITKNIDTQELTKIQEIKQIDGLTKKFYKKINIKFKKESISSTTMKRLASFDLICFELNDYTQLKFAIDLQPDLITFDFSNENLKLKPGFIRDAINRNIYFEITLRDSLYSDKKEWLRNVNDLLKITKGRKTVIGTGAMFATEFKRPKDVEMMLNFFIPEKRAKMVINRNSYDLLEQCAFRRNSFRNAITNNTKKGPLKEDFINKHFN